MPGILDRRLLFVTGKGGVGKTTVAAALGLAAAKSGKRTLVVEVAEREHITAVFGSPPAGFREVELAPGLHALSIDPEQARSEWLRRQLHSSTLTGVLRRSNLFQYLAAAAPGLDELVTVGKIWEAAQLERRTPGTTPYDLVIVDAPATGHGVALMRAPRTYSEIARVGPVSRHAETIHSFIVDPRFTAVVAVALAEEMPVNETIDLDHRLRDELGVELERVIVNALLPERLTAADARAIEAVDGAGSSIARAALEAALTARQTVAAQRAQLARLRRGVDAKVMSLPHLLTPDVERKDLERLARRLEHKL